MLKDFFNMATYLNYMFDEYTSVEGKDYNDYLRWGLMYESIQQCYSLLEDLTDYSFCNSIQVREYYKTNENETYIDDIRACMHELIGYDDANLNADLEQLNCILDVHITQLNTIEEFAKRWLPFVKDTFEKIDDYYDKAYDEFKDIIINSYYDFLDKNEETLREDLENQIYERKILKSYSDDPKPEHYAELLKIMREEIYSNVLKYKVLADTFKISKAWNIVDEVYIDFIKKECKSDSEIQLFFRLFAEISILHELTKPKIKMCRRTEQLIPLPDAIEPGINDDLRANKMLRSIIAKLCERVGKRGAGIKWSHVKRVMEDEGIIDRNLNETAFGKVIAEICSDIKWDNCRKNVNEYPIALKDIEKNKKYYDWGIMNKDRRYCLSVAKDFVPLLRLMYPERDFQILS